MVEVKLPKAHSHSSLNQFHTCPYQYYRDRVVKDIPREQGEAALWGEYVHTALEEFVRDGTVLPSNVAHLQGTADKIAALSGDKICEAELAIDAHWLPVAWSDPTVWFRAKVDVLVQRKETREVMVLDYKTGSSKYGTHGQEERYAAMVMVHYPWCDEVKLRWMYLKDDVVKRFSFRRADFDAVCSTITEPVREINTAYDRDHWEKKPSGLCNGWCGVKDCDWWRPKRQYKT